MNQTVTVTYRLSPAGQKAALLAGKPASQDVTEAMPLEDAGLLDSITIRPDGSLGLDASANYAPDYAFHPRLELDAPPVTLEVLIGAWKIHRAAIDAQIAQQRAEREAKQSAERLEAEQKAAADAPVVDALLTELEAVPLTSPLPPEVFATDFNLGRHGCTNYTLDNAQKSRLRALLTARSKAAQEAKDAAKRAEDEARQAMIAEHGGYLFHPEAGMCAFKGFGLWCGGQSRRWVGIFTQSRGVDTFLDSPRGEFVFEVSSLSSGDCIQGGGFDTNSRGKRRNESEWFGVVIRNDDTGLIVRICDSRAATLAAAKKLK